LVAGAAVLDAARLGVAMTALQVGIGSVNDLADARADAIGKAAKPIPSGLVSPRLAAIVAGVAIALGLALSVPSGVGTVAIALVGLAIGLAYDLRLKGTAWSWLPFAVGVALLPVYAWYGAAGELPSAFLVLVPAAVAAGAALAIGNAHADLERDRSSGVASIATTLGAERAWALGVALFGGIGVVALVAAAVMGASAAQLTVIGIAGLVPFLAALTSRGLAPGGRERAWEIEAIGTAVLGAVWVWVAVT
jgi:4-hydroxybenzoate polyprenyltransferase